MCEHPNLQRGEATLTYYETDSADRTKRRNIAKRSIGAYRCPDCMQEFPHDPRPVHLRKPFSEDE